MLLITHNDLDGAGCAIMIKAKYQDVEVVSVGYDKLDEATHAALGRLGVEPDIERPGFEPDLHVFFTDIAPRRWALELIEAAPWRDRVTILDHHANNDWAEWSKTTEIPGVFDDGACGTMLCPLVPGERYRHFCAVVDAYDRWLLDSPWRAESEQLQAFFSILGFRRFVDVVGERLKWGGWAVWPDEAQMLTYMAERDEAYVKSRVAKAMLATDPEGRRFAWVVASRMTSQVGTALASLPGVEYGAVYVVEHSKVELRSIEGGANVGRIAKSRGGGGHDHAAGYPVSAVVTP